MERLLGVDGHRKREEREKKGERKILCKPIKIN